jgi:agmatinase
VYAITAELIETGKFLVLLGGDHSVSAGCFRAMNEAFGPLAVIQIDAHADLRDTYEDSPESHACIMSRIREITRNTLQLGIRSMSAGEARRIERERIALCTMAQYRKGTFDLDAALHRLPERIYLTLDVDALDWGVVRTTGTPEPGGFGWDEILALLKRIFEQKQVMGFDVVELSGDPPDRNSAFAVAKLIYRMLGFKMANVLKARAADWPDSPSGPLT